MKGGTDCWTSQVVESSSARGGGCGCRRRLASNVRRRTRACNPNVSARRSAAAEDIGAEDSSIPSAPAVASLERSWVGLSTPSRWSRPGRQRTSGAGSEGPVQDLERALKRVREYARRDTGGRHRSRAHLPTGRGRRARVRRRHESSIVPLRGKYLCNGRGESRGRFAEEQNRMLTRCASANSRCTTSAICRSRRRTASEHDAAVAALIHKHGHVILHFELPRPGQPHAFDRRRPAARCPQRSARPQRLVCWQRGARRCQISEIFRGRPL